MDEKFECRINTELVFDIDVCNIPRNAKLCFVVYEVNKFAKGTKTKKTKDMGKVKKLTLSIKFISVSLCNFLIFSMKYINIFHNILFVVTL